MHQGTYPMLERVKGVQLLHKRYTISAKKWLLMSLVAHRFGHVEFRISNICFDFFMWAFLKKTTKYIQNLTRSNR